MHNNGIGIVVLIEIIVVNDQKLVFLSVVKCKLNHNAIIDNVICFRNVLIK